MLGTGAVSGLVAVVLTMLAGIQAKAAIYHIEIGDHWLPGSTSGSSVIASFQDVNPGTVLFTLSAVNLAEGEKLTRLFLNLDPVLNPKQLVFSPMERTGNFSLPRIRKGENKFKAGHTGKHDLRLKFSSRNAAAFTDGDSFTCQITGPSDLLASSFLSLSRPTGHHDPSYGANRLRQLHGSQSGDGQSRSVFTRMGNLTIQVVPEPGPLSLLLLAGAVGVIKRRRIWRRK